MVMHDLWSKPGYTDVSVGRNTAERLLVTDGMAKVLRYFKIGARAIPDQMCSAYQSSLQSLLKNASLDNVIEEEETRGSKAKCDENSSDAKLQVKESRVQFQINDDADSAGASDILPEPRSKSRGSMFLASAVPRASRRIAKKFSLSFSFSSTISRSKSHIEEEGSKTTEAQAFSASDLSLSVGSFLDSSFTSSSSEDDFGPLPGSVLCATSKARRAKRRLSTSFSSSFPSAILRSRVHPSTLEEHNETSDEDFYASSPEIPCRPWRLGRHRRRQGKFGPSIVKGK